MNKKELENIEIVKARNEMTYGDVVKFKKKYYVILDIFKIDGAITRYTVFAPEIGVYTVFSNEVEFVEHLDEADRMFDMLRRL